MKKIERALISVSDKTGIVEFSKSLVEMGVEIISTGGTAKILAENGVPAVEVSDYTGFPEMLDGRVKTLHPKIHAGLLARGDKPEHLEQLKANGIPVINMVVVNLYPFEATISKKEAGLAEAVENIDIGGPTMLRAAAKNHESTAVLVNPDSYGGIISEMEENGGALSAGTRKKLMVEVFIHTARYDSVISNYLSEKLGGAPEFPENITEAYKKEQELRYGENPHQKAGFYSRIYPPSEKFEKLQGKELSFNNILDLDAAFSIACDLEEPSAAVIKHTNPCGAASGKDLPSAYDSAYECDTVSAFGSVIGLNREVCPETARRISGSPFVEAVIAPAFDKEALKILEPKTNMRLIKADIKKHASCGPDMKNTAWGILKQDRDCRDVEPSSIKTVTERKPSDEEFASLLFAWKIAKHVKSNSIVLARKTQTVGIGAGQMSRLDSVIIACRKAGERAEGSVMGSDAFFPFPDGIEEAAKNGVKAVIQPGGSLKDKDVIEACNRLGIAMVFTGMRHFKH